MDLPWTSDSIVLFCYRFPVWMCIPTHTHPSLYIPATMYILVPLLFVLCLLLLVLYTFSNCRPFLKRGPYTCIALFCLGSLIWMCVSLLTCTIHTQKGMANTECPSGLLHRWDIKMILKVQSTLTITRSLGLAKLPLHNSGLSNMLFILGAFD